MPGYGGDCFSVNTIALDTKLEIQQFGKAENKPALPDIWVEWLEPEESRARLQEILKKFANPGVRWRIMPQDRTSYKAKSESPEFLAEALLKLLFLTHLELVQAINSKGLAVKIPWDGMLKLPSLPTLAADASAFAVLCSWPNKTVGILAKSFSGWETFSEETMNCACGSSMKLKKVPIKIMTATIVKSEESSVSLKNLIGVKTEDVGHLENHYSFSEVCPEDDLMRIIARSESKIRLENNGNGFSAEIVSEKSAREFNQKLFILAVEKAVGAMKA